MEKLRQLFVLIVLTLMPLSVLAQPVTAAPPAYSQAQIQQMLAPIALYPDPLIAQILMASTYPLEVVEAYRWLQEPANAGLQGDQLAAALEQKAWDPSVKSLVPFPQILHTLNDNIEWTEQVGDAFLAQQTDVMDSIQRLRQEAIAAGHLTSSPQQTVETQGQSILIVPANPDVVYVPAYNPSLVYGNWIYSDYPPYYFPGMAYAGAAIGFIVGVAVLDSFWGWNHWDWRNHRIDIDNDRFQHINRGIPPLRSGEWQHDAAHRRGVPYSAAVTRSQTGTHFNESGARPDFRGYGLRSVSSNVVHATVAPQRPSAPVQAFQQPMREIARPSAAAIPQHQAAPIQRSAAPLFESFSRAQDVQRQAERGASSRAASPPPSGGGRGGGGQRNERNR